MTFTVDNYVTDYWLTDNIVDCCDIIIEEKLNNIHEYNDVKIINESTIKFTQFNRINKERNTPRHCIRKYFNRNKYSNNRIPNKQVTDEYINIFKHTNTNNSKRQMHTVSSNSRLCEYKERKILLDTFFYVKKK
jgi:hypothetical protein